MSLTSLFSNLFRLDLRLFLVSQHHQLVQTLLLLGRQPIGQERVKGGVLSGKIYGLDQNPISYCSFKVLQITLTRQHLLERDELIDRIVRLFIVDRCQIAFQRCFIHFVIRIIIIIGVVFLFFILSIKKF